MRGWHVEKDSEEYWEEVAVTSDAPLTVVGRIRRNPRNDDASRWYWFVELREDGRHVLEDSNWTASLEAARAQANGSVDGMVRRLRRMAQVLRCFEEEACIKEPENEGEMK